MAKVGGFWKIYFKLPDDFIRTLSPNARGQLQRRDGLRVVRIQYDAVACAACPGCERLDWMQCRDARTTRFFTGRDRDLAPVFDFPVEPFALEFHDAALGRQWRDLRDAEFDGFLDGVIHALAPGEWNAEMNGQRAFVRRLDDGLDADRQAVALRCIDAARIIRAVTVEEDDGIARAAAQNLEQVLRRLAIDDVCHAGCKFRLPENSRRTHPGVRQRRSRPRFFQSLSVGPDWFMV